MNGLLAPAALAAAILAVPILITYMLKTRRPRQVIPSTFLWRTATKNVAASRPWDRIRSSVLLFLQLLLLAALVLALAQPYRTASGVAGDHLILVVDASGSMAAREGRSPRLTEAKLEAVKLVDSLDPGATVSVVAADQRPRVMISSSNNKDEAVAALDSIETSDANTDFAEAFLLAESLETPGRPATIALVSDGGLTEEELKLVPPGAIVRRVGVGSTNLAVTGLEVGDAGGGFKALVQVRNFTDTDEEVELSVDVDDVEVASEAVLVPAGASAERSFDLGPRSGRVIASIDASDDLPHDDRAYAVMERTSPKRIMLVGPGNFFLEKLLEQIPGAEIETSRRSVDGDGFDLVVYDRADLPNKVKAPALFIAPKSAPSGVKSRGSVRRPLITYIATDDPLLDQVDLSDLAIARTEKVRIPAGRTLIGTEEGADDVPMIATWTQGSLRRAFIGFALHESNLPLQVAFPIFTDRLLSWLTGTEPVTARYAGDRIDVPPLPGTTAIEVAIPTAKGERLLPGQALEDTPRTGFYQITFLKGEEVLGESTVALSFPPSESAIAPRNVPVEPDPGRPGITRTARHPVIASVLLSALLLLLLEWWWGHGRPGVSRLNPRARRERAA